MNCPHWLECGIAGGGCCGPGGKFPGKTVSRGTCHRCLGLPPPSPKGLGGVIAGITGRLGIKKCGGCGEREKVLDKIVPNPHRSES